MPFYARVTLVEQRICPNVDVGQVGADRAISCEFTPKLVPSLSRGVTPPEGARWGETAPSALPPCFGPACPL